MFNETYHLDDPLEVEDPLEMAMNIAPPGVFVEFGVYKGDTLRRLNNKRLGAIGFDSFQGLPEDWRPDYPAGMFSTNGVAPNIPGAIIVVGQFGPDIFKTKAKCALLHVDCDLYHSTVWALQWFAQYRIPDAIIVFDELWGYEGCENHEWRALCESGLAYVPLFKSSQAGQKFAVRVP